MSEEQKTRRPFRISLRTMLEMVFVLGVIFAVAKEHYRSTIKRGEFLEINVVGTLPDQPIEGIYQVDQTGKVPLGPCYGYVAVEGLDVEAASAAINSHLRPILNDPEVSVARIGDNELLKLQAENRKLKAEIARLDPTVQPASQGKPIQIFEQIETRSSLPSGYNQGPGATFFDNMHPYADAPASP